MRRRVGAILFLTLGCLGPTEPRPELVGEGTPVMFVGSSYLYWQDIPGIVQALADSAGGERIAVMTIAEPDFALIDHWRRGIVQRELSRHDFRWVVLQQGPSSVQINRDSLRLLTGLFADEMARVGNATPALFSAWPSASRRQDFARAIESYTLAAADVGGVLLPVAASWLEAWDRQSTLQMYDDNLHPSPVGAYLAALVVYTELLGVSPIGLPASVTTRSGNTITIDAALAATLQDVAATVTAVAP
jgi:hypothetical protein